MQAKHSHQDLVFAEITKLLPKSEPIVTSDTKLIGSSSAIDSMKLVQLCVNLESLASELGFEFDWTSRDAMSRSRSMFRSAGDLALEFSRQMEESN